LNSGQGVQSRDETDYRSLWQEEVQSRSALGLQVVTCAASE